MKLILEMNTINKYGNSVFRTNKKGQKFSSFHTSYLNVMRNIYLKFVELIFLCFTKTLIFLEI